MREPAEDDASAGSRVELEAESMPRNVAGMDKQTRQIAEKEKNRERTQGHGKLL